MTNPTDDAVRRGGTQVGRYLSSIMPSLRTAPDLNPVSVYKHLTPNGVKNCVLTSRPTSDRRRSIFSNPRWWNQPMKQRPTTSPILFSALIGFIGLSALVVAAQTGSSTPTQTDPSNTAQTSSPSPSPNTTPSPAPTGSPQVIKVLEGHLELDDIIRIRSTISPVGRDERFY